MSEPAGDEAPKRRQYASRMPTDARREQLLDAALEIAVSRGPREVNMEAVARESGVTKPVVYGVFANSDALFEALVEREQRRAMRQMLEAMPDDVDLADPIAAASVAIARFFATVRANPATWRLLLAAEQLPDGARAQRDRARALLTQQITALAEAGLQKRRSGPLDAELVARLIVVGVESGARLVLEDPVAYSEERMVPFVTELVRSVQEG